MASFKEMFEIGQDFDSFVSGGLDAEVFAVNKFVRKLMAGTAISHSTLERLSAVVGNYNLLVAAEMWCPDCHVNIPTFNYICQLQPRIGMSIISKGRAEDDLQARLGLDSILVPVVAILEFNFNLVGKFVERPMFVVQDGTPEILADYKAGKYIEETVSDILDVIEAFEGRSNVSLAG